MDKIKLLIIPVIAIMLSGCNAPESNCVYEYTDVNGNTGAFKYCSSNFGNMVCTSGDFKYKVRVVEYHLICD